MLAKRQSQIEDRVFLVNKCNYKYTQEKKANVCIFFEFEVNFIHTFYLRKNKGFLRFVVAVSDPLSKSAIRCYTAQG